MGVTPFQFINTAVQQESYCIETTTSRNDKTSNDVVDDESSSSSSILLLKPITGNFVVRRIIYSTVATAKNGSISQQEQESYPPFVRIAKQVLLQPLGRSPSKTLYRPIKTTSATATRNHHHHTDDTTKTQQQQQQEDEDQNLDDNDNTWIFPSKNGVILQENTLLCVPVSSDVKQQIVYYYQVTRIQQEQEASVVDDHTPATSNDSVVQPNHEELSRRPNINLFERHQQQQLTKKNQAILHVTSSSTKFELDSSPLGSSVTRLPPLDIQRLYSFGHGSSPFRSNPIIPPHPNFGEVARALAHPGGTLSTSTTNATTMSSTAADAATRILHVIGTDHDHDLQKCIEIAAHEIGCQCLSVRGLAAFGYNQGHVPRTGGGLLDQLAGLQSAVDYVRHRRMEPCVLHLHNIDHELNQLDEPLRHEQEDRFWVKFMEGTATTTTASINSPRSFPSTFNPRQRKENDQGWDFTTTPPLIIVISTASPLKPGPWLERLVFPSIQLSTPDDAYIRYLWNDTNSMLTEKMMSFLRGRPTKELIQLKQQNYDQHCDEGTTTTSLITLEKLENACRDLDATRRKATSNVSKISNVHWEDVGGLDHVRAEIMDAIELPLKYPHLFPQNTGRSGILLFGPPGTGMGYFAGFF
jgi:hypothetical protein